MNVGKKRVYRFNVERPVALAAALLMAERKDEHVSL